MRPTSRSRRRLVAVLASSSIALTGLGALGAATSADAAPSASQERGQRGGMTWEKHERKRWQARYVDVQMLSFNDFHGNLQPPTGSGGRIVTGHELDDEGNPGDTTIEGAGGAERLATKLSQLRKKARHSVTVAAGDLVGATPLLSAAFHDEPTIESLNKLGLDVSAVGNHEFDNGYQELQRKQRGGCIDDGDGENNRNSCPDGRFKGADFDYLAANVKYAGTGDTILPGYAIKRIGGAKIGFIGMTLEGTPDIVTASGVAGLEFTDEVRTANALVPKLKRQGVNAIVVLVHEGGTPNRETWTGPDGEQYGRLNPSYDYACAKGGSLQDTSPILPIAANLDPAIDAVVTGHTHQPYVCDVKDPRGKSRLVTSASSAGRLVTETTLRYDLAKRDIVRASVAGANVPVSPDLPKDRRQTRLIERYTELVTPIASRVLGTIADDVTTDQSPQGESALGNLIADAQLADESVVTGGEQPVIAFMNPGGIRASLVRDNQSYGEAPGEVTYAEAFAVQPFNNFLVSITLTGQQIYDLLAEQVTGPNAASPKILQVSEGFSYERGPEGAVDGSVTLDGVPLDKAASYRIVTNNFLADGGDGFPTFAEGTGRYFGGLDIDAFADYLEASSPYTPTPLDRIQ